MQSFSSARAVDRIGSRRWPRRHGAAAIVIVPLLSLAACDEPASAPTRAPSPIVRASAAVGASASGADAGAAIPGQYIVVFTDSVKDSPALAERLIAERGGEMKFSYSAAVKGFAARLPEQAAAALARNPMVARVEPDRVLSENAIQPNAPWGLDRIDQRALPLDGTYGSRGSGAGVNVYIIDSGIRTTHAEFGGRAFGAFTAVNDGRGTDDCTGHGTFVASVAAGATYGVAKGATVHAVRVFDCAGSASSSAVLAGVDWVMKNAKRPAVANMSLGGAVSATLNSAVANAVTSGIVFAVSAGNGAVDACTQSPASAAAAITVASVNSADYQASWSNFGSCVDLYAPGVNVRAGWYTSDTATTSSSGTSTSAPFVAGAAALYLESRPTASSSDVTQAILASATRGGLRNLGAGSPDRLLYAAELSVPSSPTTPVPVAGADTSTAAGSVGASDAPPVASFASTCSRGSCSFDASGSSDDRGIVAFEWDFGDGTSGVVGTVARTTHEYAARGTYLVTLTVRDAADQRALVTRQLSVKRGG